MNGELNFELIYLIKKESSIRYLSINMLHEFLLPNKILLTEEPANSYTAADILESKYPAKQFNLPSVLNLMNYFEADEQQIKNLNQYLFGCIPSTVFKNFILEKVRNWEEYYGIREEALKSFAMSQYANIIILEGCLQDFLLKFLDFQLEDIRINLNKGIILWHQHRYSQNISFNYNEDIQKLQKFRFSRNFIVLFHQQLLIVQDFLTSYGIEGVVASAFISTSDALISSNQIFVHYLFTFIYEIYNIQNGYNLEWNQEVFSEILLSLNNFLKKISSKKIINNGEFDLDAYTYIKQLSNQDQQKTLPLFYKPWF